MAATYATIRPGEQGAHVTAIQHALNSLGYPLAADGKYGQMTTQAVRAFQLAQRLTDDGLAGHRTLTALYMLAPAFAPEGSLPLPTAAPVQPGTRRYEMGAYGSEVSQLQVRLNSLGYACGRTDGVFDAQTREAVLSFQRTNRLSADGIAGTMTLSRVYADNAAPYTGTQGDIQPTVDPPAVTPPVSTSLPGVRLEMGSLGAEVVRLQIHLSELGFLRGAADGKFGRLTREAVIAYQRNNSLTADGIAGAKTLVRLYADEGTPVQPQPTATPAPAPGEPAATLPPVKPTLQWAEVFTDNGGALNLRNSMETRSSNVIAGLAVGTRVEVLKTIGEWSQIRHNNRDGYVMSRFLRAAPDVPAASPTPVVTVAPTAAPVTSEPTEAPTEVPPFPRVLRSGSTGDDVTKLQQELKALAYDLTETGVYDAATLAAVARFQALNAVTADGVFGSQSAQVLLSGYARRADEQPLVYKTLRIDNSDGNGNDIRTMQERLKALGYRVSVNGVFDILTHEAVVGFQRRNGLTVSGIADVPMQARLYADGARDASVPVDEPGADEGKGGGPAGGSVRLLHWFNDIKPSVSSRQNITVYDPRSGISFGIRFYSLGNHADSEPATLRDTLLMNRAFGAPSWDVHVVYIKLPSGMWTMASMHNRPHLTGAVNNNGFGGHLCIHFLRDLDEAQRNDPNYGMANQRAIRSAWTSLTGQIVE